MANSKNDTRAILYNVDKDLLANWVISLGLGSAPVDRRLIVVVAAMSRNDVVPTRLFLL